MIEFKKKNKFLYLSLPLQAQPHIEQSLYQGTKTGHWRPRSLLEVGGRSRITNFPTYGSELQPTKIHHLHTSSQYILLRQFQRENGVHHCSYIKKRPVRIYLPGFGPVNRL